MKTLTKDTKIKLSQIKDLKNWVEDIRYQIGQISAKTGLLKTTEGWIKPPHTIKELKNGNDTIIGGSPGPGGDDPRFQKKRSAKDNQVKPIKEIIRFKKDTPLTNEDGWYIPAGQKLENAKSIARAEGIDEVKILIDNHLLPGGRKTKSKDWEKIAGNTELAKEGKRRRAHVHGYRCKGIGKVKMKRVSWISSRGTKNGK